MSTYPQPVTILNAQTSAPTPPAYNSGNGWGLVPKAWQGGGVDDFDIEIHATGSNAVTAAKLVGGCPELLVTLADDDADAVTNAADTLTVTGHAYVTGDGPVRLTTTDTLPAGLSLATDYWIIVVDANTIQLAESWERAMQSLAVSLADDGTGTHTISKTSTTKRVKWLSVGLLGESADGAITLTAAMGWRGRVKHSHRTLIYSVVGTFGSAVDTTVVLSPVFSNPRG